MPRGKALKEVDLLNRKYKRQYINGGVRSYDEEGSEEELDDYESGRIAYLLENYPDIDENNKEGHRSRSRFIKDFLIKGNKHTVQQANEAGFINEFHFAKEHNWEWNPILKYSEDMYSDKGFFAPVDFMDDTEVIEIKTVKQGTYKYPIFWCPKKKVDDILSLPQSNKWICWAVCKDFEDIIEKRNIFTGYWVCYNLKYFIEDQKKKLICMTDRIKDEYDELQPTYVFTFRMMKSYNKTLQEKYPETDEGPDRDWECKTTSVTYKTKSKMKQQSF